MEWNQSETIALAKMSCSQCNGFGMRRGARNQDRPCGCVFRAIFRACYRRFRECVGQGARTSIVSLDWGGGPGGKRFYGRRVEEYIADFCLVSRRALSDADYRIFKFHFLLGADSKLCCRRLRMDRGRFFHDLYRIQTLLGRTYRELQPYSLFPLDEYFGGAVRKAQPWRRTDLTADGRRVTAVKKSPQHAGGVRRRAVDLGRRGVRNHR